MTHRILVVFFALAISGTSNADMVVYEFEGLLPTGSSQHSQVDDGETFLASFIFDSDAPDQFTFSSNQGAYSFLSGSIQFSGGYSQELMFPDNLGLGILDNIDFINDNNQEILLDVVTVQNTAGNGNGFFSVLVATDDPSALTSDELLGPGAGFATPTSIGTNLAQLNFFDPPNGAINYTTADATNTSFTVRAVPEPASGLLFATATILIWTRRSRVSLTA